MPVRLVHHEQILVSVAADDSWLWCEPTKASHSDLKMESEKNKNQKHFEISSKVYNFNTDWFSRKKGIVPWMTYLFVQRLFLHITVCIYINVFCEESVCKIAAHEHHCILKNLTKNHPHIWAQTNKLLEVPPCQSKDDVTCHTQNVQYWRLTMCLLHLCPPLLSITIIYANFCL